MADSDVLYDRPAPGVARITYNRPELRNPTGRAQRARTDALVDQALADDTVGAVIITGAGGHFCAGGDIREFGSVEVTEQLANVRKAQLLAGKILRADKPFIAAVEGFAAGAGVGIACLCDIIIGDANSKFALSFVKIGMTPDMGLTYTLSHRVGLARARRMLMRAETVAGEAALAVGLLDEFTEPGGVQARALAIATDLAQAPPGSLASLKRGIRVAGASLDAVLEYEAGAMAVALTGKEVAEGARAFLEKRRPNFRG